MTSDSRRQTNPLVRWTGLIIGAGLGAAAVIYLLTIVLPAPQSEDLIRVEREVILAEAELALHNNRFDEAEKLARSIPSDDASFAKSRLIAGEAATKSNHIDRAIAYYREVENQTSPDALTAVYALAELYRSQCKLEQACKAYEYVLSHDDKDAASHERLAFILGVTRRHWDAVPHYMALVHLKVWTLDSLAILSDIERSVEQQQFVKDCAEKAPQDSLSMLAQASEFVYQGRSDDAKAMLAKIIKQAPELATAQAMLGELSLTDSDQAMTEWNNTLPGSVESNPDIWFVRGLQCRKQQKQELAAGCFAIAVTLAPEHRRATYQLGQMLSQLKAPEAEAFMARARNQADLGLLLDRVLSSRGQDEDALLKVTELSERTGRMWEAWGWAQTASTLHPAAAWPHDVVSRIARQLSPDLPRTIPAFNLIRKFDLSRYTTSARSHRWKVSGPTDVPAATPAELASDSSIRFQRETDIGIDFRYNNGSDPATPGARMFEQTGGGVGVIDYNNDGWPDLYFTQGGIWKTGATTPTPSSDYLDVLYRNADGRRFHNIAEQARIRNDAFSQGIAVADFDADGFEDIFISNIGGNELYRNNGDGTFEDQSAAIQDNERQWTTSAVMIDMNGDSLPDIFEVNYLQGPEVFTLICDGKGCSPKVFEGAPDQLRINLGDGTFRRIPDACPTQESKGLGVVAFKLADEKTPALFVSNDQVANHLLITTWKDAEHAELIDEALLRGLAFNNDGLPMACMGIAADDIDRNGLLDLFVTNFANEADILYLQDAPGLFVDATPTSGTQSANFSFVGWGAQFLDAELDGNPDLVVVNGHIDDYRGNGGYFEMPPQFYRNVGKGKFDYRPARNVGEFFEGRYSGRAMAKLDWNRDGRMDFVVSNIGAPAALVTNATERVGHYLTVRLRGTSDARDALGSTVTVRTERGTWTKQLSGGDGYQASNERVLQFGLGLESSIKEITVTWPSGGQSIVRDCPADQTIEIVQGAADGSFVLSQKPTVSDAALPQP
ncbi:MAG: FG-GAP-like repeat-containing protein [Pirellulales bacterium]